MESSALRYCASFSMPLCDWPSLPISRLLKRLSRRAKYRAGKIEAPGAHTAVRHDTGAQRSVKVVLLAGKVDLPCLRTFQSLNWKWTNIWASVSFLAGCMMAVLQYCSVLLHESTLLLQEMVAVRTSRRRSSCPGVSSCLMGFTSWAERLLQILLFRYPL